MARKKDKAKRQVMGRDKWRKKKEEQDAKRQSSNPIILPKGVEFLKLTKKGVRLFELLPYEVTDPNHPAADVGDLYYCRPFKRHSNIGQNNSKVICPSTWGKPCPICKERAALKADNGDEDEVKKLNASDRGLYVFQDRADNDTIVVFESGFWAKGRTHGFGLMLEDEIGYQDESDGLPWDWDGPSLKIRFGEDTFMKTKFYPVEKLDLKEDGKDVDPDIMDDVPNLDECLVRLSYEEIEKMFFGMDEDDDEENEDKVAKREAKAKPKPKPKSKKKEEEQEPKSEEADNIILIRDWDPDEVDFDDSDEAEDARNTLLEAAENLELDTSSIKKTLTGPNNDTERGIIKLQKKLVELLDEVPEPEEKPTKPKPKPKPKKKEKNACPHDHKFGTDWEDFTECEDCDVEDACSKVE